MVLQRIGHKLLPLSIQSRDGHTDIYCEAANDCAWHWPLYRGSVQTNGKAVEAAIEHVLNRHGEEMTP